ncbi:Vitamin B12 transporter BtuB [Neolewinella maritima]|uniref:Vitamin B12 transporter BtuB n=1 Tax=Neolewinella maritima TaxID=1383882 RepID=A0ABM9AY69_9BACT|nr:TonB-dependent receptor [Neolewinella maritima]CAH0999364.1 Vitamin B12 transporter BtuB [Neolewinella maritima]
MTLQVNKAARRVALVTMRYLLFVFVLAAACCSTTLRAQEAELMGTVTGPQGDTLIGASVRVVGSVIGAVTDLEGHYILSVPPGRIRLLATYLGFENYDTVVVVSTTDRELEVDIRMEESFMTTGEVIVYGRRAAGQAQALRVQQSAVVPQTILHAETFNKYPDITLAETVQRMPGVTITRNRGEGELVQVRGLPEQYTAISLNGQRLPAVQPEADRAGSLDIIQSNLVEEVRVIKARSADMDADAIGGTVDFRIRQPEDKAEILLQAGGGSNFGFDQIPGQSSSITQAAAVLNSELSDEAVYGLLAGSYFRHNRGNRTQRFDYGENGTTGREISRVRPIDTDRMTTKTGLVGAVELRPSIYNRMRLSYNYSANDDEVMTRETNFNRGNATTALEDRISSRWKEERRLNMVALEVENNFKLTQLTYALSFASTSERLRDRQRAFNSSTVDNGAATADRPFEDLLPTDTRFAGQSLERRFTEQLNLNLEEDIAIGGVNITRHLNSSRTSFLRAGGRYRIKERTYEEFYQGVAGGGPAVPSTGFPDLSNESLLDEDPDLTSGPNYYASEKIAAGYLMYLTNWTAKLTTSVGLRYEYTDLDYTLQRSQDTDSTSYNDLFPSLNITYRLRRDHQLRFSYYDAIARVPYATVVPTQRFAERRQARLDVFSLDNPDVSPTYSRNLDLTYERYGRNDGLISVSAYAKFLTDPTVRVANFEFVNEQPSLGYSIANTADARLLGLELGFYQSLAFLNPKLRILNVNGNVNLNSYQLDGDDTDNTLAQAPRRSANLSFVYSNPRTRLNLVLAGNYRSSTLDLLRDGQPVWINAVISLDLAADYELFKGISAYVRVNNATDHRAERYIGKPDQDDSLLLSKTQFGVWGVAGLRWRPGR